CQSTSARSARNGGGTRRATEIDEAAPGTGRGRQLVHGAHGDAPARVAGGADEVGLVTVGDSDEGVAPATWARVKWSRRCLLCIPRRRVCQGPAGHETAPDAHEHVVVARRPRSQGPGG